MGGVPGVDLVKKGFEGAKNVGGAVVDKGKQVVDKGADVAKAGAGVVKSGVEDTVELGQDAWKFKTDQELKFAKGVVGWGKDSFDTVKGIVTHPVETGKALFNLGTNPILNPVGGLARAAIEGKNPIEAYKDGGEQLKGIGSGLIEGYKKQYDENGIAGVAGYLAPDVALAVLSGGSSAGAKGAGTAAAKGVAREVAEETVEQSVTRTIAKDIAKEVAPGPEDLADSTRKANEQRQNDRRFGFLNPLGEFFNSLG